MQNIKIVTPQNYVSMPWRNGLGQTCELLKENLPDDNEYAWRLSMADVTTDGEFSNFDGYDRTLLLLVGKGITLEFEHSKRCDLGRSLQSVQFKGDERTIATLHDGPIRDFNVMTLRSHCTAEVYGHNRTDIKKIKLHSDILLAYAVDDQLSIQLENTEIVTLPAGHLLHVQNPEQQSVVFNDAKFIAVQIRYY
ncbi:MAG: hypothetical protein DHS20C01_02360 [marine bacterium B5-7]|nr:MAG: hypothetical protein DHS20C01_02360 [marine bacterium B5-7]